MGGPPPFGSRNRVMGMDRGRGRGGRGRRGFEDEPNWGNDSFNDGGFRQRGKKRGRNSFEEPGRGQDDYDDWANNDSWNEESSFTNPRSPFSNFAWSEYERDEPSQSAENWQNQRGGRGRFDRGGGNFPRQVGPGPSPSRMPPSQMHMQEGPLIPAPRGKPMPLFAVTPGPNKGRKPSPFFGGTLRPHSPVSFAPEAGHHPHTAPVLTPSPASMPSCPVPKLSFPPGFPPFHPSRRMSPPSCVRSSAPTTLQPPPKAPRIGTPSASDSDLPPPPPPPPPMDFDVVPVPPPPPIFNPPAPSS
ncbi:hypothetical protein WR25_12981 [Diploscapter pachys]|uniref:Uncharacterized protein n=1 Tax=Diploscapter pachys TaxID=2018661 RepID=A0A2A2LKI6_9BILA|nr:hypothetical protein WR25_12981 [Diploscapter pachys]